MAATDARRGRPRQDGPNVRNGSSDEHSITPCTDWRRMRETRREYGRSRRRGRCVQPVVLRRDLADMEATVALARRLRFAPWEIVELTKGADDLQLASLRRLWAGDR